MRRSKLARRSLLALLYIVWGAAVAWFSILPAALRAGFLHATIERKVGEALGCAVRLGQIDFPNGRELTVRGTTITPSMPGLGAVEIESVRVSFAGLAPLSELSEIAIDGVKARVDLAVDHLKPTAAPPGAPPSTPIRLAVPRTLPTIRATRVSIDGTVGGEAVSLRELDVRLERDGSFAGTGRLATSSDPEIDVRGSITDGRVRFDRLKIGTLSAKAGLATPGDKDMTGNFAIDSFKIPRALQSVLEGVTGVKARGLVTTSLAFTLDGTRLASLEFEGELVNYEVEKSGVRVAHKKDRTRVKLSVTTHPAGGWAATGTLSDVEVQLGGGFVLHFPQAAYDAHIDGGRSAGTIRFADAFCSQGEFESSRTEGDLAFDVTRDAENRVFTGSTRLTLRHAEMLRGEIYQEVDKDHVLELLLAGRFDIEAGNYEFRGTGASLGGVGKISLDGSVRRGGNGFVYDVGIETDDLSAKELAARLAAMYSIEDITMAGRIRAKARLTGEAGEYALDGRATLIDVAIRKGPLAIAKLEGEIPLMISKRRDFDRTERGWISFEDLVPMKGISLGKRRLEAVARTNSLRFPDTISFDLFGGRATLGEIAIWDIANSPHYDLKCGATDIDLTLLVKSFGSDRRLKGSASIEHGPVLISMQQVTILKPLRLSIFEGMAEFQHIRVLKPADPVHRAYQMGFVAGGLRLRDICRTMTEFGAIDGVADAQGMIELHTSGLPNWFQIQMRTVKRDGVEQMCDLKAIRALARVMSGEDIAARLQELRTDKLYYDKFGFFAAMDVDFSLYLRGFWWQPRGSSTFTEVPIEDLKVGKRPKTPGLEFLMVGTGRQQVNMNIANPGVGIDFNDLLDRFKKVK